MILSYWPTISSTAKPDMKNVLLLATSLMVMIAALDASGCANPQPNHQEGEREVGPTPSTFSTGPAVAETAELEPTPCGSTIETSFSEEDIDNVIWPCAFADVASAQSHYIIARKDRYTDPAGTRWIGFALQPTPKESAQGGYGVIKEIRVGKWTLVVLGTGPFNSVPADVAEAFGLAQSR